jgi:hypothetical protein
MEKSQQSPARPVDAGNNVDFGMMELLYMKQ